MLPVQHRLRTRADFSTVTRQGRRCVCPEFVAYYRIDGVGPSRLGLIVGKSVGNAVVRHQVSRRLRHEFARHMMRMPSGTQVVLRALPAASGASSAELASSVARVADKASS